jgi:F-type H+-transporting ATPase subunit epsilon
MVSQWWRNAGFSYLNYSSICAKYLRRALKPEFRQIALKDEHSIIKCQAWEGGKPSGPLKQYKPGSLSGEVVEK